MSRISLLPPPATSRTVWLVLLAKSTVPVPLMETICLRPDADAKLA